MRTTDIKLYHDLTIYSLSHQGKNFIHQYVVDSFTAQNATVNTSAIAVFYALAGLYLHVEKGFNGKQVQEAHLKFSKQTKNYPTINLPAFRGELNIRNIAVSEPGIERDQAIENWAKCVWDCYQNEREKIITLTEKLL